MKFKDPFSNAKTGECKGRHILQEIETETEKVTLTLEYCVTGTHDLEYLGYYFYKLLIQDNYLGNTIERVGNENIREILDVEYTHHSFDDKFRIRTKEAEYLIKVGVFEVTYTDGNTVEEKLNCNPWPVIYHCNSKEQNSGGGGNDPIIVGPIIIQ